VKGGDISSEGWRAAPQLLQNLVSAALSALHLGHFMGSDLPNLNYFSFSFGYKIVHGVRP